MYTGVVHLNAFLAGFQSDVANADARRERVAHDVVAQAVALAVFIGSLGLRNHLRMTRQGYLLIAEVQLAGERPAVKDVASLVLEHRNCLVCLECLHHVIVAD